MAQACGGKTPFRVDFLLIAVYRGDMSNKAKFVSPFTDFGFKKIFGEEASLPVLRSFLNSVLPDEARIETLQFRNTEFMGRSAEERKAIFDLYCENEKGEKFIVELQKAEQKFFKDRTVFYSTFPIQQQGVKGRWDYGLKKVYCIGILNFLLDDYEDENEQGEVIHMVQLKNQKNQVFYDKLLYMFIEMPNFRKSADELESEQDKWLYFLKNLEELETIPEIFSSGSEVFDQAFEKANVAMLSAEERELYESSLKNQRDWFSIVKTAEEKGMEKGMEKGREEGREEGMEKGMEKGKLEALRLLIDSGMSEAEARKRLGLG